MKKPTNTEALAGLHSQQFSVIIEQRKATLTKRPHNIFRQFILNALLNHEEETGSVGAEITLTAMLKKGSKAGLTPGEIRAGAYSLTRMGLLNQRTDGEQVYLSLAEVIR